MEPRSRTFLIWGAGGHGRVVGDLLLAAGHRIRGFVDSDVEKLGTVVHPLEVSVNFPEGAFLSQLQTTGNYPEGVDACALGLGDNRMRLRCLESLRGLAAPPVIHPTATVSGASQIGQGSVVFAQAVVNVGARIGEAVVINSGSIVEHDCSLENAVHVSPGAVICGGVKIGEGSWIGAGATVIHGVTIGSKVIVGAGSTVIHDVEDGVTVVGSPAQSKHV